jgi:hypothetical protein
MFTTGAIVLILITTMVLYNLTLLAVSTTHTLKEIKKTK